MTYSILIGQRSYSSWSLRGWLAFAAFGIPVKVEEALIYGPDFYDTVAGFGGHRSVPVVRTPEGGMLTDSLAIGWHLAEAFPDAGLLPDDPVDRAEAMSMIAEMHSGFGALRQACPMNLRNGWDGFVADDAVQADLGRLEAMWKAARDRSGGPFLFGRYSLADATFAPVAARIAGYDLPVSAAARAYVQAHLEHLPFRQWRAMGLVRDAELSNYDMTLPRVPFPLPAPVSAHPVDTGPSVNAACPYSSKSPTDFAEIGGRVWGFCNPGCRDKTVADPLAWPAFAEIYLS